MSQEGYLQIKVRELQDKVDMLNQNIDNKIIKMETIEKKIDNKLQGKLKIIVESEGKIEGFANELKKEFFDIFKNKIDMLDKIMASKIRQGVLFNANTILKHQQDNFNEIEKINKIFSEDVYANIRILFCYIHNVCDNLNIKTKELPDIPNKYGIRNATTKDIIPIIEKKLDELGLK